MSLEYRIRRRLGHDTTFEQERTEPIRRYEVLHLNGETTELLAHGYRTEGAFAIFYEYNDFYIWNAFQHRIAPLRSDIRTLEGIQEITGEKVGKTTFRATVDRADGETLSTEIENGL